MTVVIIIIIILTIFIIMKVLLVSVPTTPATREPQSCQGPREPLSLPQASGQVVPNTSCP